MASCDDPTLPKHLRVCGGYHARGRGGGCVRRSRRDASSASDTKGSGRSHTARNAVTDTLADTDSAACRDTVSSAVEFKHKDTLSTTVEFKADDTTSAAGGFKPELTVDDAAVGFKATNAENTFRA